MIDLLDTSGGVLTMEKERFTLTHDSTIDGPNSQCCCLFVESFCVRAHAIAYSKVSNVPNLAYYGIKATTRVVLRIPFTIPHSTMGKQISVFCMM